MKNLLRAVLALLILSAITPSTLPKAARFARLRGMIRDRALGILLKTTA